MEKFTCYRVDHRELGEGEVIQSCGDHIDQLPDALKEAELSLRKSSTEREKIRGKSLYAFGDLTRAEKYFLGKKGYLYEIEVDVQDLMHSADMTLVNEISTALKEDARQSLINSYWSGERRDGGWVELLATKAIVRKRLYTAKDKVTLKNKLYR